MKKSIEAVVLIWILSGLSLKAQDFKTAAQSEIAKFDFIIGQWKGQGWMYTKEGTKENSSVEENINYDLDSTIILMKGLGMSLKDEKWMKTHDALGVLSYDVFQRKFKMNSWLNKGMSTTAHVEYRGNGSFTWWFETGPNMIIRYKVFIQGGRWNEIGERSIDGENWIKFFEMNLEKISN